jgi:uncharacterized protein (DUF362 family)
MMTGSRNSAGKSNFPMLDRVAVSLRNGLSYCDPFDSSSDSYQDVKKQYDLVLEGLGLDSAYSGTPVWNPFADFIAPNSSVLIKPNFVRHIHVNNGDIWSLITAPIILKLTVDYCFKALSRNSRVIVGDAPIQSADFETLASLYGFQRFVDHYSQDGHELVFKDFRREACVKVCEAGFNFLHSRREVCPADCFREINLGEDSFLASLGGAIARRFRVGDYRVSGMRRAHNSHDHKYLVHQDVLQADVIIGLSKLKTHRKAGMTCAMKNFVGINGHKDYLPHLSAGSREEGGDEYEIRSVARSVEGFMQDCANAATYLPLSPKSSIRTQRIIKLLRRYATAVARRIGTYDDYGKGSWHGNDTIWRTIGDLNRIVCYANQEGRLCAEPQRAVFNIVDGIVGGDREGPLAPRRRPVGLLAGGMSAYMVDYVMCGAIGFDWHKLPALAKTHQAENKFSKSHRISRDHKHVRIALNGNAVTHDEFLAKCNIRYEPNQGWKNFVEIRPSGSSLLPLSTGDGGRNGNDCDLNQETGT